MAKMNDSKQKPDLSLSPSFGDGERRPIYAAEPRSGDDSDGGDEFDCEFEFSIGSPSPAGDPAGEIFADGRILPVYPVFNRSLLSPSDPNPDPRGLRSGSNSSTSSADSLDIAAAAGSYCAWAPRSPEACKKSSSTGSGSKRWKVRDLVGGRRSHSDGKEKLVNFTSSSGSGAHPHPKLGKGEMDLVTAHRLFYGKDKGGEKGNGKRSFLLTSPSWWGFLQIAGPTTTTRSTSRIFQQKNKLFSLSLF